MFAGMAETGLPTAVACNLSESARLAVRWKTT
jgi:hypothetical protein